MNPASNDPLYDRIGPRWREWCESGMCGPFMTSSASREITMSDIAWEVSAHYDISRAVLLAPGRQRQLTFPRFLAMHLIREFKPDLTVMAIAEYFKFDHTSVLHGLRRAENLLEQDKDFRIAYEAIRSKL